MPRPEPDALPSATRRTVLRAGGAAGLALLGGALSACADDAEPDAQPPGGPTGRPTDAAAGPVAGDVDLAGAAVTFENSAVSLYGAMLADRAAELEAAGLTALLERLRDHHVEHAAALNRFLRAQGLDPIPPDRLFAGIPVLAPEELAELPTDDLAGLLLDREDVLAQSYVGTLPRLTHAPLRLLVATIGATEARHVAALDVETGGLDAHLTRVAGFDAGRHPVERSLLDG